MKQYHAFFTLLLLTVLAAVMAAPAFASEPERPLLLATTTSTDNTGLLDYLVPRFTRATGIKLKWVATGTGKALKLGERCDADVLMVHAPGAEKKFVAAGFGINRRQIMYNDFVLVGPVDDPAAIKGQTICGALAAISRQASIFVSRGDNSGTNKKELALWRECVPDMQPGRDWYLETGQGMLSTMSIAGERGGYTLTDRGTYIKYEANNNGEPPLVIMVEGGPSLLNQYSVIEVHPSRCDNVLNDAARSFGDWLISPAGQEAIGAFRLLGKQLFIPNGAGK